MLSSTARNAIWIAILGAWCSTPATAAAQSSDWAFEKIVDYDTPIPGGTDKFRGLYEPAMSGGNAAFYGSDAFEPPHRDGIYSSTLNGLIKVADRSTPVPDGTGPFSMFYVAVHASGDRIVFSGADANWRKGLYLSAGRALSRIVDENTALPSGGGQFVLSDLADASISQDTVVFVLRSSPGRTGGVSRATLGSSARSWTAPLRFPKAMGPSRISTPPPWTGRALRSSGRARTASSAHTSPMDRPW